MTLEQYALIAEIIGGAVIVLTLIVLIAQVRENTRAVQGSAFHQQTGRLIELKLRPMENAELAHVIFSGLKSPQDLSDVDWWRFRRYGYMLFGIWEGVFLDFERGAVSKALLEDWERYFKGVAMTPGFLRFWNEEGPTHRLTFQEYINGKIYTDAASQPRVVEE